MIEQFNQISELLSHFYAIINRPNQTEETKKKALAIIDKLNSTNIVTLEATKNKMAEIKLKKLTAKQEQARETVVAVTNSMIFLIQRARSALSNL